MKRSLLTRRRLGLWAGIFGVTVCTVIAGGYGAMRASLPKLDGELHVGGLTASVQVARDADGVPTINASNRNDGLYALGFLHAQERFFQMDLLRRSAAGELAALLGLSVLDNDRNNRRFRFRARAEAAVKQLDPDSRRALERYTAGVNEGMSRLLMRPFEYLVLGTEPHPWQLEDSLLAVWAMYQTLQENQEPREFARGWLAQRSTPEQLAVLLPESSRFDVPIDTVSIPDSNASVPVEGPLWLGQPTTMNQRPPHLAVGSNSWAIASSRSAHRGAILANDMHLGLQLPNTWYRAVLTYPVGNRPHRVVGVTLPGVPLFPVGTNGKVAWGMTNSYGDYLDLIGIQYDPGRPGTVKADRGWEQMRRYDELIEVKGAAPVRLSVLETATGPLHTIGGRNYIVRWAALDPDAVNLRLAGLETAVAIDDGADIAAQAGIPAQNIMLADVSGRIGWSIAGLLPARQPNDASFKTTFPQESGQSGQWAGRMPVHAYPRLFEPAGNVLWNANNRQLGGPEYARLGDGGADLGARAQQIRDGLSRLRQATEADLMGIALDTSPRYMLAWRTQALQVLKPSAVERHKQRAEFRRLLESSWEEQAIVNSVGYRLARGYYRALYQQLFGFVDEQLAAIYPDASYELANPRWGEVAMRLLKERPAGWLKDGRKWEELELAAIDDVIAKLSADGRPLSEANWGERNRAEIRHPLASSLPFGDRWLAAPPDPLPGDDDMPRVSSPDFGQSQRFVVSPGKEELGMFNMPGGQSGHPLSSYFLAGHDAWVRGVATPLLPGPQRYLLTLSPRASEKTDARRNE